MLFTGYLNILASSGMFTIGADYTGLDYAVDVAKHLVLPAATLSILYNRQLAIRRGSD